ncbi:hypothetical protein ABZU86_23535 [Streptomyces sp. NPDC005271]|uniref:hypothetical protein n=1 Tax=unclassified Streptomyces TaxID=2593676 RepID=UPI0033B91466
MTPLRIAAGGLASVLVAALATGCANTAAPPSARQQVIDRVHHAYERTTALPAVSAALTETVASGTSAVAQGKGTAVWEFPHRRGETRMTVNGQTPVIALRVEDTFYEGRTRKALAGTGRDLARTGARNPTAMPQIQAPGLDPFQLTTLLGATSWPDTLESAQPVVTSDDSGQHTEYQLGIRTARLATHAKGADRTWLTAMSRQPGGEVVTVAARLSHGRISTLSAQLPIPKPHSLAKEPKGASIAPTPRPMTVLVSAEFSYVKKPQPLAVPS